MDFDIYIYIYIYGLYIPMNLTNSVSRFMRNSIASVRSPPVT